jgi:hypothetical protein
MHYMQHLSKIGLSVLLALIATPALAQYQGQPQTQPVYGAPQQGYPMNGMPAQQGVPNGMVTGAMPARPAFGAPPQTGAPMRAPSQPLSIGQWFTRYDQIRFDAQMSPQERQQADALMSRGLSILVPGDNKIATKQLLSMMVGRYQRACAQLKELPQIGPTQQLQGNYFNYFNTAGGLFADYLRVQDNLFLTDATTGTPVAAGLIQRKQMLEALEAQCKQMDSVARQQFGIPAYRY